MDNINKPKKVTPKIKKDTTQEYSYYSNVLKEPFNSLEELKQAEESYYTKIREKEDKAAEKKADATLVEEAFKALNRARKAYREGLVAITERYSEDLKALKKALEEDKTKMQTILAEAEEAYATALKAFTDKYRDGYHLTLKDGDFETTISSQSTVNANKTASSIMNIFDLFFSL